MNTASFPGAARGRVTLVGAGPGDPELLTLRAVRAIAEADVILVDDLVDRRVLAHARPGTNIVDVGKRGGCASTPQAFIERRLLVEARAGRHAVRLKGGDPFVFGRGGEECAMLRARGVTVEVVPGLTSGLAAPAAIGIPVTHRDHSRGVILVTGHAREDAADYVRETDWAALARTGLTLVIYMGVARLPAIRAALLSAGMPGTTPAAVVRSATLPAQAHLLTTLDAIETDLRAGGLGSPAIVIVGDVAALADPGAAGRDVPIGRDDASRRSA